MSKIKNTEIFFLEYLFPKHLNYKYSGGVVENMIIPINQDLLRMVKLILKIVISKTKNIWTRFLFDEKITSQYLYKDKINTMISKEENDIKLF